MSLHETITADIQSLIEGCAGADIISPTTIALALQTQYGVEAVHLAVAYASLEHFKHMARRALARRYDHESDEAEAYQGELFSGSLQRRYPTPRASGEEPAYKLLESLTDEEVRWNIKSLEHSADARSRHARALAAWFASKRDAA